MELFYIIKCQYINRRGGGYLVELRADGDQFRLRRQGHEDEPDQVFFRRRQIDQSQPYAEKQILAADIAVILDELGQARLSPIPPLTGGFDGANYLLSIRNIESETAYEWWLDCPAGWEPLERAWRAFVALSEEQEDM